MDPSTVSILAAIGAALAGGAFSGAITGLISSGKNAAVIAQLRVEVNQLTANKDQLFQAHSRHETEIALLKQSVSRTEASLTRLESAVEGLPGQLRVQFADQLREILRKGD